MTVTQKLITISYQTMKTEEHFFLWNLPLFYFFLIDSQYLNKTIIFQLIDDDINNFKKMKIYLLSIVLFVLSILILKQKWWVLVNCGMVGCYFFGFYHHIYVNEFAVSSREFYHPINVPKSASKFSSHIISSIFTPL